MQYHRFLRSSPWPLYILAALLPASYLPTLQLGTISGVHIDISLLYIVLIAFVGLYLPRLWQERTTILTSWPCRWLIAFGSWQTVTLIWTPNLFRGLATTIFVWLLIAAVFSVVAQRNVIWRTRHGLLIAAGVGVGVSCLMALWQVFGDALGVSPTLTGLPEMYRSTVFGVARPTGLTLEPQFLASLLIAPLLLGVWWLSTKPLNWRAWIATTLVGIVMLLTLSRGGIGAVEIGIFIVLIAVTLRTSWRRVAMVVSSGLAALVIGFVMIGLAGALNTRDDRSGYDTVRATVSQLSLGVISLPQVTTPAPPPPAVAPSSTRPEKTNPPPSPHNDYVEKSTDSRLSMTELGIELWRSSPQTILFGVGSGGFGAALATTDPAYTAGTVANNYYIELLAELGLIGAVLWLTLIIGLVWQLVRRRWWLGVALVAAFSAQWYFFSGHANVIHIWIIVGCLVALVTRQNSRRI